MQATISISVVIFGYLFIIYGFGMALNRQNLWRGAAFSMGIVGFVLVCHGVWYLAHS